MSVNNKEIIIHDDESSDEEIIDTRPLHKRSDKQITIKKEIDLENFLKSKGKTISECNKELKLRTFDSKSKHHKVLIYFKTIISAAQSIFLLTIISIYCYHLHPVNNFYSNSLLSHLLTISKSN